MCVCVVAVVIVAAALLAFRNAFHGGTAQLSILGIGMCVAKLISS